MIDGLFQRKKHCFRVGSLDFLCLVFFILINFKASNSGLLNKVATFSLALKPSIFICYVYKSLLKLQVFACYVYNAKNIQVASEPYNQLKYYHSMQKNFLAINKGINYWAIIPAAGIGARMQNTTPKQYLILNNKEIIVHSINELLSANIFSKIMVALAPTDKHFAKLNIANNNHIITTIGGDQRYNSVLNSIKAIQKTQQYSLNDWVLVHDAARPCLNKQDIALLINKLQDDAIGGILGYPASDTIKIVDQQSNIQSTPDRSNLWHAVTPQMFRMGVLLESLEYCIKHNIAVTDEASAVENLGYNPKIFNGSVGNIKVTTQEDMLLAEYYLQQTKES